MVRLSSNNRRNDCERPSSLSFLWPCRVNGWHGGESSQIPPSSLSNADTGSPYMFFWDGRTPKLCSYVSLPFGLMSKAATTLAPGLARNKE